MLGMSRFSKWLWLLSVRDSIVTFQTFAEYLAPFSSVVFFFFSHSPLPQSTSLFFNIIIDNYFSFPQHNVILQNSNRALVNLSAGYHSGHNCKLKIEEKTQLYSIYGYGNHGARVMS